MAERELHHAGRACDASEPRWPEASRAPEDAPNVPADIFDDARSDQPDSYRGLIDTPGIDCLAGNGSRYGGCYFTALWSPDDGVRYRSAGRDFEPVGPPTSHAGSRRVVDGSTIEEA